MAWTEGERRGEIYPLPHMPVVKDLIPDLTHFYAQQAPSIPACGFEPRTAERRQGNGKPVSMPSPSWMGSMMFI